MKRAFPFIVITVLGVVVFGRSLFHPFVWDDEEQIINNQAIKTLANVPHFFLGSTFNSGGAEGLTGLYYKPFLTLSYSLIYSLSALSPIGYHSFQIGLHIVNASLFYLFIHKFSKRKVVALLSSIVFLIHPLQVESVVYVAGLQEPLFFFFGMLSLLSNRPLMQGLFLFASLLSKETGVVFVLILPLYQYAREKRIVPSTVASAASLAIYLALRFLIARLPIMEHELTPINRVDFWQRLPTIPAIITHYLGDIVAPFSLSISEHWVVDTISFHSFFLPLGIIVLLFLIVIYAVCKLASRRKEALFWLTLLVLSVGIHLHFVPLDFTTSDRWMYLPLAALAGFVQTFVPTSIRISQLISNLAFILLTSYGLVLTFVAYLRVYDWRDGYYLYQKDINKNPNSFDLSNNYGVELYRSGQVLKAKEYFISSTNLAPYWWTNWNNLGVVFENEGKYNDALSAYSQAIENGSYYLAIENYAKLLYRLDEKEKLRIFVDEYLPVMPKNMILRELKTTL